MKSICWKRFRKRRRRKRKKSRKKELEKELDKEIEDKDKIVNKTINTYESEVGVDVYVTYEVLENIGTNEKIVF